MTRTTDVLEQASASEDWVATSERGKTVIAQLARLDKDEFVAVDTEGTGLRVEYPDEDFCIGISVAFRWEGEKTSFYFPIAHETGTNIDDDTYDALVSALTGCEHPLIFVNVQYDTISLGYAGFDVTEQPFYDLPTMSMMIDENRPIQRSLNALAQHYVDKDAGKVVDKFVEKEKRTGNHNITPEQMFEYACVDAELTLETFEKMIEHPEWAYLSDETDLWERKQQLIMGPLLHMRMRGILTDMDVIDAQLSEGEAIMAQLEEEMQLVPTKRNDMHEALIERLGLPVVKKTPKGEPSFDKDAMAIYDTMLEDSGDPMAKQIKTWRGWQKAITASYRPYKHLRGSDGRIRTTFNTHRTVTGRLSSSDPNLQQIPKDTEGKPWSKQVKNSFCARPGYTLLSADYSQLELRILAAYAQSQTLMRIFAEGRDLFTEMAAEMGFPRKQVKGFVYANNYGAGDRKISAQLGIPYKIAVKLRRSYQSHYPELRRFAEICTMKAEKAMKVRIWSGRYRHLKYRSEAYKAMNSVMQGGGADIVERVMVRLWNELDRDGECEMLLQVHDAVVFEVRDDLVEQARLRIKEIMEDVDAVTDGLFQGVIFNVEVTKWGED